MLYIYIIIIAIIVLLIYMSYEATLLAIKKVVLTDNKKPLKAAHLSDIHIPLLRVSTEKVLVALNKEKPDILFLTGDYIERQKDIPDFIKFLSKIKGNRTVFMVLGNHDCDVFCDDNILQKRFISDLDSLGINLLLNSSVYFAKGEHKYNIIGISDFTTKHQNIEKAYKHINQKSIANITLSHNPDIVFELPPEKTDYLFSGHLHGGQIWTPFNFEARILRKDKLSKLGINQGLHKFNNICLYINRGLGNVLFPLRFLSRPELTIYYLP